MDRKAYEQQRRELQALLTRREVLKRGAVGIAALSLPGVLATSGAAQAAAVKKGGTLVFGVDALTGNSDPAIFASFGNWMAIDCMARGLTHIDYHTTKVKPNLAARWEVSKSRTVYRFHLRKGLTFHDGNPVTANDCVRTFSRLMNEKDPSRPPGTYSIAELGGSNVKKVRAIGDSTFEITLRVPDVAFLARLSNPNGVILSAAAIDKYGKKIGTHLVGAGPFKFVSSTPGQSTTLEAFEGYWEGRPSLDKVVLQVLPDPSALTSALRSGSVQVSNFAPRSNIEALKKNPRLRVQEGRPYIDIFIGMNVAVPLLRDLRVRLAINYCVDRKAIVQVAFNGAAQLPAGLISPPELGYDPSLRKYSTQDIPRAKALLKAAGAVGKSVSLVNQNILFWPKLGQILEQNFKEIGLNLKVEYLDEATYNAKQYDPKGHELFLQQRSAFVPDPDNKLSPLLAGDSFVNKVQTQNYLLPSQKQLDRLLTAARQERDPAKRAKLYKALQIFLQEKVMVFAMLANISLPVVSSAKVTGVNADALGTYRTFLEKVVYTQ
jgi:peptide/nickel transport system substrate-binding protein